MAAEKTMKVELDYTNMLACAVSAKQGVTTREWTAAAKKVRALHKNLTGPRTPGFRRILDDDETPRRILQFARQTRGRFADVVVLGVGGSALGTRALADALLNPYHNARESVRKGAPRLTVMDNVDPAHIRATFSLLDPRTTFFNVVTKSGSTAETMGLFAFARRWTRRALKDRWREHFVVTTGPERGDLREIAVSERLASFDVPLDVGGRFSVLTPVGLLPAALVGIDVKGLMAGAKAMAAKTGSSDIDRNIAYALAAFQFLVDTRKSAPVQVLMPYARGLGAFVEWFRQLWAESLGKRLDLDGRVVESGPTPLGAMGVTDQHSLLQLFMEGPRNKIVTFLRILDHPKTAALGGPGMDCDSLAYLKGATFADLIDAELAGTAIALTRARRPNMTLSIDRLDAPHMGALFVLFETAVAMAALLYNVDAFDQPGVEASKHATYALMGREGYQALGRKPRRTL